MQAVNAGEVIEFDYGSTPLADKGSEEEMQAFLGESTYYGKPGITEAIWLIEGVKPWPGPPWPRPVYRVRWRAL